jgi:uncharacterized protein YdhG (YjbR/CyaY superfamily)
MWTKPKASTFDEYLAALDEGKRAALERLRKTIRSVAPRAEECIAYGLAAFRLGGKPLVAIGASANHCALYPMNGATVAAFKRELKGFETSKGTIRFHETQPLPAALVRKIVKARLMENAAGRSRPSVQGRTRKRSP